MKFYNDAMSVDNTKDIFSNIFSHIGLKIILSLVLSSIHWVFKGQFEGLTVITTLVCIDTLTGVIKALKVGDCSSKKFFRVLVKLLVYFTLLANSYLIDRILPTPVAATITLTFLGITEGISVIENLVVLKFPATEIILRKIKFVTDKLIKKEDE